MLGSTRARSRPRSSPSLMPRRRWCLPDDEFASARRAGGRAAGRRPGGCRGVPRTAREARRRRERCPGGSSDGPTERSATARTPPRRSTGCSTAFRSPAATSSSPRSWPTRTRTAFSSASPAPDRPSSRRSRRACVPFRPSSSRVAPARGSTVSKRCRSRTRRSAGARASAGPCWPPGRSTSLPTCALTGEMHTMSRRGERISVFVFALAVAPAAVRRRGVCGRVCPRRILL